MITLKSRVDKLQSLEDGEYIAYGVDVYEGDKFIESIPDLTFTSSSIDSFVNLCNENEVEYIHLYDIIEDVLFTK